MTINEMIKKAGWFKGTDEDWRRLSLNEQAELAFAATGCLIAYATWTGPVDCRHLDCQLRRGEIAPLDKTRALLSAERHGGWLKDMAEDAYQRLVEAACRAAEACGEYDPWKIPGGWQAMVGAAIGVAR